MKKKIVFLGGGYRKHQVIYMLPILEGYCQRHGINGILIEHKKIPDLKKKNSNIIFLDDILSNHKIRYYFLLIYNIFNLIINFSFLSPKKILKINNWYKYQLAKSLWDFSIKNNKVYLEKPELRSYFKSIYYSARTLSVSNIILNEFHLHTAFMHHLVYFARPFTALFRKKNIKIISKSLGVLRLQKKNFDQVSNSLSKMIYKKSNNFIPQKKINAYWKNFYLKKKSNYFDAKNSSKIKTKLKGEKNIIFLHVFRDSPFISMDKKKIFLDYFHWFVTTLNIIKNSKEKWQVRVHPSAKNWGEDTIKILRYIAMKYFNGSLPKNIRIINNEISNIDQLNHAKKIVTFSGHAHLEAACFGIKPIIISQATLSDYSSKFFFKPKSYNEYKKLLLIKSDDKKFKLSKLYSDRSKRILYLLHNAVNFNEDFNDQGLFFHSTSKNTFEKTYSLINKRLNKNYSYLFRLGQLIGKDLDQSLNLKYLKKFRLSIKN